MNPTLEDLEHELETQAHLFDRPSDYQAGVKDALAAVSRTIEMEVIGGDAAGNGRE